MKSMFLKSTIMLMFAFITLTITSCWNDEKVEVPFKEEMTGTWDITSYKLDGTEWMGFLIESASIRFNAYSGAEGQFDQTVTFPDEESATISGAYTVDEVRKEVRMVYDDQVIVAEITITNRNKMVWKSIQDEYPLVLEATKR